MSGCGSLSFGSRGRVRRRALAAPMSDRTHRHTRSGTWVAWMRSSRCGVLLWRSGRQRRRTAASLRRMRSSSRCREARRSLVAGRCPQDGRVAELCHGRSHRAIASHASGSSPRPVGAVSAGTGRPVTRANQTSRSAVFGVTTRSPTPTSSPSGGRAPAAWASFRVEWTSSHNRQITGPRPTGMSNHQASSGMPSWR